MIPHRPKRQDVVLTCQGNDQHNVLLVADLAAKQVINRPPVITGGQAHVIKISEHTPGFSLIATIAATDPDGDRLTYRLTAGASLTIDEHSYEQFYLAAIIIYVLLINIMII
ncbi:MAG: cadherin repeat domain-containing protein [Alphaproteobacteria bacterium]|nr:cadherin repeat domain-containing protein [Alphaproteobacteria bacterium]MDG2466027.1 cadherin repeat domain-containing protein [Alphaproteobacteria bacterium]